MTCSNIYLYKVRKPYHRPWHRHENEEILRSTGLKNTADI